VYLFRKRSQEDVVVQITKGIVVMHNEFQNVKYMSQDPFGIMPFSLLTSIEKGIKSETTACSGSGFLINLKNTMMIFDRMLLLSFSKITNRNYTIKGDCQTFVNLGYSGTIDFDMIVLIAYLP